MACVVVERLMRKKVSGNVVSSSISRLETRRLRG
jgi:hypothetical protein